MSTEPMTTEVLAPPATPAAPPTPGTPAAPPAPPAAAGTGTAETASRLRRRVVVLAGLRRLVGSAFTVALLAGGVSLGYTAFLNSQPVTPAVADPATTDVDAPPAVAELTAALVSNDADKVRAAVQGDPYRLLTGEMQRWDFQEVSSVETLSTVVDEGRTSTQLIIVGKATDGTPVTVNLIVQTQDGAIVSFR